MPSALGNLTKLTSLHLNYGKLTGTLPASFGSLQNLAVLWIQNNSFHGMCRILSSKVDVTTCYDYSY